MAVPNRKPARAGSPALTAAVSAQGIESVVSGRPVEKRDSYQTGDLRFGLEAGKWAASIIVNSLWDERANLFLNNRSATQRQSVNRPRTIGLQFRYEF